MLKRYTIQQKRDISRLYITLPISDIHIFVFSIDHISNKFQTNLTFSNSSLHQQIPLTSKLNLTPNDQAPDVSNLLYNATVGDYGIHGLIVTLVSVVVFLFVEITIQLYKSLSRSINQLLEYQLCVFIYSLPTNEKHSR